MKKLIQSTVFLTLLSTWLFAQDTTYYKNVNLVVIDPGGTTQPPDTLLPCQTCPPGKDGVSPTVNIGTTTTLPAGSPATVTDSDPTANLTLNFGVPQGPEGPPSSGGGGTQTRNVFDVTLPPYGAIAGDNIDDLPVFQRAANDARSAAGLLRIPSPGNGTNYIWNGTLQIVPDASNQNWIDIEMLGGRAGGIKYTGPSNAPVVKIVGLKGGIFTGLNIAIESGRTNVQIFDIVTPSSAQGSTSFVTFNNFYLNLGNGTDNIGIRTGAGSHPGDISNYEFNNISVFGGGGLSGASIAGQYAFQNLGTNTLSMSWKGGFVAFCDRAYTNISRDRTSRGNASVSFYGLGGAHNNIDFEFAWEQSYIVSGGRWENGQKFMRVSAGGQSNIVVEGVTVHDYHAANNIIELLSGTTVHLDQVQIVQTKDANKRYNPAILLNAPRVSSLNITGGGYSTDQLYSKTGGALWNITVNGAAKILIQYPTDFFPNEIGVRK